MATILRSSRTSHGRVDRRDDGVGSWDARKSGCQVVRKTLRVQSPGGCGWGCFEDNSFHPDELETKDHGEHHLACPGHPCGIFSTVDGDLNLRDAARVCVQEGKSHY